ncbi:MAG TPA: radical SAM protein, partial [Synechococcus sp. UBA9887]|nr:radical SAM protein [Synechococcus sp. UBA9887]
VLAGLGRRHRRADLLEACRWMREALRQGALRSWSLDLIQNLPGQTRLAWEQQLAQAIAMDSPHVSVYDLSVEPGTVFERRQQRGELDLPEEELAAELMALTSDHLGAAGLGRYEISNHAR